MNLEFYGKFSWSKWTALTWEELFEELHPDDVIFVESHDELDFVTALQFMFGKEAKIQIYNESGNQFKEIWENGRCVHVSWNPTDRNRI